MEELGMKKRILAALSAAVLTMYAAPLLVHGTSIPNTTTARSIDQTPIDESLWEKFLRYDLCITDYAAMSESEQALCRFIFETEQSAKDTVRCERARRMLSQDPAIGPRLTLEQLEDCYGIWDRFSEYKVGQSWFLHCVQDIKRLDYQENYNEYWLDDAGTKRILAAGENTGSDRAITFEAVLTNLDDAKQYDAADAEIKENKDGTFTLTYEIQRKTPRPSYHYTLVDGVETLVSSGFMESDGDLYMLCPDRTAAFVKSKYSMRTPNTAADPIRDVVTIPEQINGYPVTTVEQSAFMFAPVTKIQLPDTIRFIDAKAFYRCPYLREVNFPSALQYIGAMAFEACGLETLALQCRDLQISQYAFRDCAQLGDLRLLAASIGSDAFCGCTALKKVRLENGIVRIDSGAFRNCGKIGHLSMPESLKIIGVGAFPMLSSITIPESVAVIGALPKAFGVRTTALITIPATNPLTDPEDPVFDQNGTIYGNRDTEAQRYAEEHTYPFTELTTLPGDVNSDGALTVADILCMQRYLVSRDLTLINRQMADWNQDGVINATDLALLKRTLMRLSVGVLS